MTEIPINLNEVEQSIGYLRLYNTNYYATLNKPIVEKDDEFWDQACFHGVIY